MLTHPHAALGRRRALLPPDVPLRAVHPADARRHPGPGGRDRLPGAVPDRRTTGKSGCWSSRGRAPGSTSPASRWRAGTVLPANFVGAGVVSRGLDNVEIYGGTIRGYRQGIRIEGGRGHRIARVDVSGSRRQLLKSTPEQYDEADWLDIFHADTAEWYGGGILLKQTNGATVTGVSARHAQNGIGLIGATASYIADNDVSENSGWGIHLWASSRNVVVRNQAHHNVRCESPAYRRGCDSAGHPPPGGERLEPGRRQRRHLVGRRVLPERAARVREALGGQHGPPQRRLLVLPQRLRIHLQPRKRLPGESRRQLRLRLLARLLHGQHGAGQHRPRLAIDRHRDRARQRQPAARRTW